MKEKKKKEKNLEKELREARERIIQLEEELSIFKNKALDLSGDEVAFYNILNASPLSIGITRLKDSKVLFANKHSVDLIGVDLKDYIGSYSMNVWANPEDRERFLEIFRKEGRVQGQEMQVKRLDGSTIWCINTWEKIKYKGYDCILYWAYNIDRIKKKEEDLNRSYIELEDLISKRTDALNHEIKERIAVENALRNSEYKFRRIFENMRGGYLLSDLDGNILLSNPASAALLKYGLGELSNLNLYRDIYLNPGDGEKLKDQVLKHGSVEKHDIIFKRKDSEVINVEFNIQVVKDEKNEITAFELIFRDITERKNAEKDRNRLIRIVEMTKSLVSMAMPDSSVFYMNSSGRSMVGWGIDEDLKDKKISDVHPGWAFKLVTETGIPEAVKNGSWEGETALIGSDGREIPVSQVIIVHKGLNDEVEYLSTIMRDISERKHNEKEIIIKSQAMEAAYEELEATNEELEATNEILLDAQKSLRESENQYRLLVERMNDGLVVVDENMVIKYVNPMLCRMLGYEKDEIMGGPVIDLFDGDNKSIIEKETNKRKKGIFNNYEVEWLKKNGDTVFTKVSPQVIKNENGEFAGTFAVVSDITDYKKSQELLIQSEKMMTVGGLAAGMAHEINNPLGVILQGIQLIQIRLSPDMKKNRQIAIDSGTTLDSVRDYLDKRGILGYLKSISEAGSRAAEIVANMLTFSRKSSSRKLPCDINDLIDNTIEIASKDYDMTKNYDFRQIKIIRDYNSLLPKVSCSYPEIEQVVLNLLSNSAHAMHDFKNKMKLDNFKPEISIKTDYSGKYIDITVVDNGPGFKTDSLTHIFEPFYTTKEVGAGTGLGLSVSYFIIKNNHNGTITAESEKDRGAKFIIKLPCRPI